MRARDLRIVKAILGGSAAAGALAAGAFIRVAFKENPQGEFFDTVTGKVDIPYSCLMFGLWFGFAFVVSASVCVAIWGLVRLAKRFGAF
jgi:hypothetical protein